MTKELIIVCPRCNEELKIRFDSSGNPTAFLLDKSPISQSDLSRYGIELGIIEGGDG